MVVSLFFQTFGSLIKDKNMPNLRTIAFGSMLLVFFACANPGVPSGGEKDEEPPKITRTSPENYSTKFNEKRIVIDFDEFVKLKDAFKNVVISPPQKNKPKLRLRERQIDIQIRDSLRPNTTYSIDFGNAIVDNNESNPLGEYRYVFTTGDKIDEMGLAGYVKGAKIDTVAKGVTVALYTPSDTLNPYQLLPDYIAQTDTLGFFMFNNIVDRAYKIIAFHDENNNSMLDADEPLAFKNDSIHTAISVGTEQKEDSLQLDKYTKFKNTNLQLRIFKPKPSQQYLKDYQRPLHEQLTLIFNAPREDTLAMELLDIEGNVDFLVEENAKGDSLTYWITNKEIANQDTLWARLSYLRTDSLGNLSPHNDTLRFAYTKTKKQKKKAKKKAKEENEKIDFMDIKTNMSGKINYFDTMTLTFERPTDELKREDITIFTKQDTIEVPLEFTLQKDSVLPFRKYHILLPLKTAQKYNLRIDSMKVYDSSGRPNKKLETSFETYDTSYYGRVFVTLSGGEEGLWIQLADKKTPDKILIQKQWKQDGQISFENLSPTTYVMKAFWDTNANGKWDTGNYRKKIQPERTKVFSKEIKVPSNWELEVEWKFKE